LLLYTAPSIARFLFRDAVNIIYFELLVFQLNHNAEIVMHPWSRGGPLQCAITPLPAEWRHQSIRSWAINNHHTPTSRFPKTIL